MSQKPPKKSDRDKNWMKKRLDREIKIQPEYHLIVAEGKDTEPQYFKAIQNAVNAQYRGKIQLDICGEGVSTLNLFKKAKAKANNNPNVYKHVWIIYDTDDFPEEHINKTAELCNYSTTKETQYHAVWSNQCIELWFLLHFGFFHSDIHRKEYWPKLSKCLKGIGQGGYYKGREDMFNVLRPYMDQAICNAKKLDKLNAGKTPTNSAPGTKVYELVEKLRPYL